MHFTVPPPRCHREAEASGNTLDGRRTTPRAGPLPACRAITAMGITIVSLTDTIRRASGRPLGSPRLSTAS